MNAREQNVAMVRFASAANMGAMRRGGGDKGGGGDKPRSKWKATCNMKPAKIVSLLGLLLVMSGMGFAYLGFDVGLTTSDDMSVALRVASGTTQMVCATVCISVGILVWAVGVHTPQAEVYG